MIVKCNPFFVTSLHIIFAHFFQGRSIPLDVPNSFIRQTTTPSPEGSDLTRSSSRDFNVGTPSTPIASSLKRYVLIFGTVFEDCLFTLSVIFVEDII